jgi:phosphatidate cytidylyltransferase
MLPARLVLGSLFIVVLVGLCWLDFHAPRPGLYLLPLAIVLGILAAGELLEMFRKRGHEPPAMVIYVGTLLTVLAAGMPVFAPDLAGRASLHGLGWLAIGLAFALLIAIISELGRFNATGTATTNLALTSLAVLYVGVLIGFLVQLRLLSGPPWGTEGRWGMVALLSLIATVKMSDIGQYTVGRLVGRHKLAPSISPGKTWEGAAGGILFAIVAACLVFRLGTNRMVSTTEAATSNSPLAADVVSSMIFAVVVAAAGMIGDLAESMLKRDAGIKDSSHWMPGFGGVLDLVDSLLVAAPVAYLFWALRWVGP